MNNIDDQWCQLVASAIDLLGEKQFFEKLAEALTITPGSGHTILFHYPLDSQPRPIYTCYQEGSPEYSLHIERYLNGPYLLDPYCEAGHRNIPAGAYQLKELAPDDFTDSEFYRVYYRETGLQDEISFMQLLGDDGHLEFSIGYVGEEDGFTQAQVELFKLVAPIVNSLVLKQWKLIDKVGVTKQEKRIHEQLQIAMNLFGSSLLTQRERSILQLLLQGHSNRSIAEKLSIAESTVKLHRKHIYGKFDISSHSELFHLFLDSLSCFEPGASEDPLLSYMGSN